jgi:hypothetical protein
MLCSSKKIVEEKVNGEVSMIKFRIYLFLCSIFREGTSRVAEVENGGVVWFGVVW